VPSSAPAAPSRQEWTLIRNARQLLTLQGQSGARRGHAMTSIGVLPGASVLIRNGLIEEVGPARRVENLAGARHAAVIDAAGKIVMPAFIDAATSLISSAPAGIRTVSKKVLQARVGAASMQFARQGCLTVGSRTGDLSHGTLRNITRVLRAHLAQQSRPLRIRSVLSACIAPQGPAENQPADFLANSLLYVHHRSLATILEFNLAEFELAGSGLTELAAAARVAAGIGFAIRFRSRCVPGAPLLRLALEAAAISVIAPVDTEPDLSAALASAGCLRIYPAREALDPSSASAAGIRRAIGAGAAVALASDASPGDPPSFNFPSLLALAVARLGLTVEEAITATTWNPACALRLAAATGSVETGKSADLLVLAVDDYRDLALPLEPCPVTLVMRAGHVIDPGH
jgi:imidazolonepropionase